MTKKKILSIWLFFVSISVSFAELPNRLEWYCLDSVESFEKVLQKELPKVYFIEKTHPSQIGPMSTDELFIRDLIIRKKVRSQDRVECLIFAYLEGRIFPSDSLKVSLEFDNSDLQLGENKPEKYKVRFGIICPNIELSSIVEHSLNSLQIVKILEEAFKANDMNDYQKFKSRMKVLVEY